jgi:hypothetical protein
LAVAKVAEDPGGERTSYGFTECIGIVSDLQMRIRLHAEGIAKDTLFTDVAGLDIVQGLSECPHGFRLKLVLLASWGSMGWRSGSKLPYSKRC